MHFRKLTLKKEVFWLGMLHSLVFSIVFIVIIANLLVNHKLTEMKEKLYTNNTRMLTYLDTVLDQNVLMLAYLENMEEINEMTPEDQQRVLFVFRNIADNSPDILAVTLAYADGLVLSNHEIQPDAAADEKTWYQEAVEAYPDVAIGYTYTIEDQDTPGFCIAKALADETDTVFAVICVDFDLNVLFQNLVDRADDDILISHLTYENGVCLIHQNSQGDDENTLLDKQGNALEFLDDHGYIEYESNGENLIGYYHKIIKTDLILINALSKESTLRPVITSVMLIVGGLCLLALAMSLVFAIIFDRRYVRPVKELRRRIGALMNGQRISSDPAAYPNHEFLEIAEGLEQLTMQKLDKEAEELNAILESTSDGILVVDQRGRILRYNTRFLILWDLPPDSVYKTYDELKLTGKIADGYLCPEPWDQATDTVLCYLKSGIILERNMRALTKVDHTDGILCMFRDVTQKVKTEEHLKEIANTDFLTGLNNRRYFMLLAMHQFRLSIQNQDPLALLMIDIDEFKVVNDTYGHDAGDLALKATAEYLRQCSRGSDILCRYGGEEFCVMLPKTDSQTATRIGERLRKFFEKAAMEYNERRIHWTISIGVGINTEDVSDIDTLIKHADIACYAAKQRGRNLLVVYEQDLCEKRCDA